MVNTRRGSPAPPRSRRSSGGSAATATASAAAGRTAAAVTAANVSYTTAPTVNTNPPVLSVLMDPFARDIDLNTKAGFSTFTAAVKAEEGWTPLKVVVLNAKELWELFDQKKSMYSWKVCYVPTAGTGGQVANATTAAAGRRNKIDLQDFRDLMSVKYNKKVTLSHVGAQFYDNTCYLEDLFRALESATCEEFRLVFKGQKNLWIKQTPGVDKHSMTADLLHTYTNLNHEGTSIHVTKLIVLFD
jgi:hypothetical protein